MVFLPTENKLHEDRPCFLLFTTKYLESRTCLILNRVLINNHRMNKQMQKTYSFAIMLVKGGICMWYGERVCVYVWFICVVNVCNVCM